MSQHDLIIQYLSIYHSITPMEAFHQLGITKLSTRIGELKRQGYIFNDTWVEDVNRFGVPCKYKRYFLVRSGVC